MPRKKKINETLNGELDENESPAIVKPRRVRKGVRVYPDELCPEWGELPPWRQRELIMAALRLGLRQIQQSPDLRCALGLEPSVGVAFSVQPKDNHEEIGDNFVLDLGG